MSNYSPAARQRTNRRLDRQTEAKHRREERAHTCSTRSGTAACCRGTTGAIA